MHLDYFLRLSVFMNSKTLYNFFGTFLCVVCISIFLSFCRDVIEKQDLIYIDEDTDSDGVLDAEDNCPENSNSNQKDTDSDKKGDICDDDDDNDGITDEEDIDDDNDGLIEIATEEQLGFIRNDLQGRSLTDNNGSANTTGCNTSGGTPCNGYEIVKDIQLKMDWTPIGNCGDGSIFVNTAGMTAESNCGGNGFSTIFDGNNHTISNIRIRASKIMDNPNPLFRSGNRGVGFFGVIEPNARIQNIHLRNMEIIGGAFRIGLLVGHSKDGAADDPEARAIIIHSSASGYILRELSEITNPATEEECTAIEGTWTNNTCNKKAIQSMRFTSREACQNGGGTWTDLRCNLSLFSSFYVGGLVGTGQRILIRNSYAHLEEINGAGLLGGLIALARNSRIEGSYARVIKMQTYDRTPRLNTLAGLVGDASSSIIHSSYAQSDSIGLYTEDANNLSILNTALPHLSAFVGIGNSTNITNSYAISSSLQIPSIYKEGNIYYGGGLVAVSETNTLPSITRSYWHISNLNRPNIWSTGLCYDANNSQIIFKNITIQATCEMGNHSWRSIGRCSNGMTTDRATCTASNQIWREGRCSDNVSMNEVDCMAVPATWTNASCSDDTSIDEITCTTGNQTWEKGVCSDSTSMTEAACMAASETWTEEACSDNRFLTENTCTERNLKWIENSDRESFNLLSIAYNCSDSLHTTEAVCIQNLSSITERDELRDKGLASKSMQELQMLPADSLIYESWDAAGCTSTQFTDDKSTSSIENILQTWSFSANTYPRLGCPSL